MRKILPIVALAVAATLSLGACSSGEQAAVPAAEQKPAIPPMPANPTDKNAWKQYLVAVVTANMQGVKSNHPYMYFVPGGDDDASKADRNNQLENVKTLGSGIRSAPFGFERPRTDDSTAAQRSRRPQLK